MARTVYEFRKMAMKKLPDWEDRRSHSDASTRLWTRLNRLGGRNIKRFPPEKKSDIDATVVLTDQEWEELEVEMNSLRGDSLEALN